MVGPSIAAEGVGFEPTGLSHRSFSNEGLNLLGHPSERRGAGFEPARTSVWPFPDPKKYVGSYAAT